MTPTVLLGLRIEGAHTVELEGPVADDRFSLSDPTGVVPAIEGPTSMAALKLAYLADLGPRLEPDPDAPVLIAGALASYDRDGLLQAWSAEAREGTALAQDDVVIWTAWAARSISRRRGTVRTTMVADAGLGGLALIDLSEDGVIVQPATATDVWRSLTGLLSWGSA